MTDRPVPLSRRTLIASAGLIALAACRKGADAQKGTLYAGDQKGGSKVVLGAAGKLKDLPYRIEWSAFPNAAPLLEALNAGAIDTGIGGDAAFIFAIGTGATIKAIGAQKYDGVGPVLVVARDSPIRSIKDIAGKRIATPRGSIAHNFILAALEAQGRPLNAVHFAFLSPQDGQAALQGGSVDGWAIWDPNAALAEKDGARIIRADGLVPSYALLFGRDGAIADKRPLLQDYARRLYAGWDWAVAHPDTYATLLHDETGIPTDVWRTVTGRTKRTGIPIDVTLIADQQKTADRYLRAGLIEKPVDVRKGFDASFTA
ncbi:ABC transporter substrate-binding protein [uncultured Sphingomonas sp.]|uniref:ABC transporter substrate-binding protein n=1 Tax=uncultured Sphingomonas sp. TaxID=158754 RepID=UPI0035CBAD8D